MLQFIYIKPKLTLTLLQPKAIMAFVTSSKPRLHILASPAYIYTWVSLIWLYTCIISLPASKSVLISPALILDSSKNENWTGSFKEFSRLKVNIIMLGYS